jgi:hypothetical protein
MRTAPGLVLVGGNWTGLTRFTRLGGESGIPTGRHEGDEKREAEGNEEDGINKINMKGMPEMKKRGRHFQFHAIHLFHVFLLEFSVSGIRLILS